MVVSAQTKIFSSSVSAATTPKAETYRLFIPAINLDTPIYPVGLNAKKLQVVLPNDVSWYAPGGVFGQQGNAVLAGHVTGIFRNLAKLQAGDKIFVFDNLGHRFDYRVARNNLYAVSNFPTQEVYGPTTGQNLNLVTCAGVYSAKAGDFLQRTVIFAKLI